MGFIENELEDVRKLAQQNLPGCKLVSCVKTMVRAEIKRTQFKAIIACIQFPEKYPDLPLLIELKSKTLSDKLLQGLTNVCENEAKKSIGNRQVMPILEFLQNFLIENPLSCCYDEINNVKKLLTDDHDEFKLKQKTSSILAKIVFKKYFFHMKIYVPNNYPEASIEIQNTESNFPPAFQRHILGQAKEIARQCVESPLKKGKPNDPPFKPKPSLEKCVCFLVNCVKLLPNEQCQFCKEQCLPVDPQFIEPNEECPKHVERIYCGHLFHKDCLFTYMKTPPFGNKRCHTCGEKIFHHKWCVSDKLAETRWAHEQARERELAEVEDFFK
ncbi:hypothetical protein RN001_003587 [Aquatica leii]|uniref:RWD domain-containing protein n=1 Tax=Aquatica leii TaxID=1421715 RepID=A0AAN7PR98_9COLE|nr:hypothetical protein RN001_003587 [Aquatica leii]